VRRQPDAGISGGRAQRRQCGVRAPLGRYPGRSLGDDRDLSPRGASNPTTSKALISPAASTLTAAMGADLMKWSARRSLSVIGPAADDPKITGYRLARVGDGGGYAVFFVEFAGRKGLDLRGRNLARLAVLADALCNCVM
jgi:hypothetical protein